MRAYSARLTHRPPCVSVRFFCSVAVILIAAPAGAQAWTVSNRAVGPVRFGMTMAQALVATGGRLRVDDCNETCCSVSLTGSEDVSFLAEDGVITRVQVTTPGIRTLSGRGVGDTEAAIQRAFPGQIRAEEHTYDENGHYLVFLPRDRADQSHGIIFDTDGQRVTGVRAGLWPSVGYVEGCY